MKWLIYGNDWLEFCNNMGLKGNLADMKFYSNTSRTLIFTDWAIYTFSAISRRSTMPAVLGFMRGVTFNDIYSTFSGRTFET